MADADAAIASFMAITGSTTRTRRASGSTPRAAAVGLRAIFGWQQGAAAPPATKDDAAVAAALHAREMEHEVRAPDSVKRGRLLATSRAPTTTRTRRRAPARSTTTRTTRRPKSRRAACRPSSAARATHAGTSNRADGKAQKWLLVVITTRPCSRATGPGLLVRRHGAGSSASFILWLRPHGPPGLDVLRPLDRDRALPLQGYSAHPCTRTGRVDPRTGRRVWTKDGKVSGWLVELLSDITERHSRKNSPVRGARAAAARRLRSSAARRGGGGFGLAAPPPPPPTPPAPPPQPPGRRGVRPGPRRRVVVAFAARLQPAPPLRRDGRRRGALPRPGRGEAGRRLRPVLASAAAARAARRPRSRTRTSSQPVQMKLTSWGNLVYPAVLNPGGNP